MRGSATLTSEIRERTKWKYLFGMQQKLPCVLYIDQEQRPQSISRLSDRLQGADEYMHGPCIVQELR